MIDIKFIRENPDIVKAGILNKNDNSNIDEILSIDLKRREKLQKVEELKSKRNSASQQIGILKKKGESTDTIMSEMKILSDEIKELDDEVKNISDKFFDLIKWVPNIPHTTTPIGKSSEENVEIRSWNPEDFSFENDFEILDHILSGQGVLTLH